ncbi:hypothetical protein F5888DRAFT_1848288 [Russula emetica]|nr:hypothetical protein F5888DRAFT_1848288 [Russula emetica]
MSSGDLSTSRPFTAPSASGTVAAESKLGKAITIARKSLKRNFPPEDNDDEFRDNLQHAWLSVHDVITSAGSLNQKDRLRDRDEFYAYIGPGTGGDQKLIRLLRSMVDGQVAWEDLFENEAFLKTELEKKTDPTRGLATKDAWGGKYKGDLADVLRETIADYLFKDRTPYARLTTVVNSSGTGKSRMVDQLGTEIITVPMCLRQGRRQGFPPLDMELRDWLVSGLGDRATVQKRLHGFIYSLLMVTHKQLVTIAKQQDISKLLVVNRQKKLASAFREHMTKGQSYHSSNSDRRIFYEKVIATAKQFVEKCEHADEKKEPEHGRYVSEGEGWQEAGYRLCRFIDEHYFLDPKNGPRRPLVVFAFDEADALTENPPNKDWNLFSDLRRVLRQIDEFPIFSLFLSTTGRFDKFSPEIRSDPSARAREPDNRPLDPISEISFDDIAYPALKGTITIDKVVTIDWISHFGRPLFGSYWDNLPEVVQKQSVVMDYAKQKLLDGQNELKSGNWAGSLACLSIRFALEFNMDGTARDVTFAQVERHMRLCIAGTAGLEKLISIPGSEPLLAEAAYELMKGTRTNAVCHLAGHSDLNCIDRGRRGELVAALLIMQAYDAARAVSGRRWVSVVNFMEALLPPSKYNHLLQSAPTSWPMDTDKQATFRELFKDYGMWFNHVIKIEKKEMISIDHLWKFVVRGAMILCATNQEGIDIVLPICHVTQNLGPDSVTTIIVQVKNAQDYKASLQANLFDAMDSVVKSAIFSTDDSELTTRTQTQAEPSKKIMKMATRPKEVIRMVFALASPAPAVVFRDRPKKRHHSEETKQFIAFDIWLAGLSDKTFRQINEGDLVHYRTLLERSLAPHDAFELKDVPHIDKKAKELRGVRRRMMAPLTFPGHGHHCIHQVKDLQYPGEGSGGQPGVAIGPGTPNPQI